jgi:hypothetical protein
MFFIYRGIVDVVSEDGLVHDTLSVGEAFGELALLFNITRTASVRARVNTDLFMLSKRDINYLMERYPQIKPQIFRIANERMKLVKSRNVQQARQSRTVSRSPDDDEFLTPLSSFSTVSNVWQPAESSMSALNALSSGPLEPEKPAVPARVDKPDVLSNMQVDGKYEIPNAVLKSQRNDYLGPVAHSGASAMVDQRPVELRDAIKAMKTAEAIKQEDSFASSSANGDQVLFNLCCS